MPNRVIVVGAGIGGLAAALELAGAGVEVTLLERAAEPGGKLRRVEAGGASMDAGPTVFTMRWVFEALFDRIGARLEDHLRLAPLSVLARHAWGEDQRLDLYADKARSADAIGAFAGVAAGRGYLDFCARAKSIFETLDAPFLRGSRPNPVSLTARVGARGLAGLARISPFETLWQELGRYFPDPRLRQLFGRYATYCGSSPFQAPATLMLVAHVEQAGVWSVDGGMHAVARALVGLAEARGARLRCAAEVAEIVVRQGRAAGVRLASGETLAADAVVFNGDAGALGAGLLGSAAAGAAPRCAPARRSLSALTWNLHATARGFPLARHTVFFSNDSPREFDELFGAGRPPSDPSVYVCAQDRHEGAAEPTGAERLLLIVNAPANGDTHPLTAEETLQCETLTFARMARCGLVLSHGSGRQPDDDADRLRPAVPVDGGRALRPGVARLAGVVQPAGGAVPAAGPLPGGRLGAPGAGGADGGALRAPGGGERAGRPAADLGAPPAFDVDVAHGGYVWWYVDALSDDGRHGLTVIAFLGSVFSPYYAWARRRRGAAAVDPLDHCAINVALYGRDGGGVKRWTMTERGRGQVERDAGGLRIGPSRLRWQDDRLVIDLDETGMPFPQRVRGTVTLDPVRRYRHPVTLSEAGRHRWFPIAPAGRVEVDLQQPNLRWSGDAYLDANQGDAPLEHAFGEWNWSRAHRGEGRAAVFYDVGRLGAAPLHVALGFEADGTVREIGRPPERSLPPSRWRVPRSTRSDADHPPRVVQTLTDAPFYARSLIDARWSGERLTVVHESLSMPRFVAPWVQAMLPFRMPRSGG